MTRSLLRQDLACESDNVVDVALSYAMKKFFRKVQKIAEDVFLEESYW